SRTGDAAPDNTSATATLSIGAATLSGTSVALDTSANFTVNDSATLAVDNLALSGDAIAFDGVFVTPKLLATLEATKGLTLKSPNAIRIATGDYTFHALVLDAPAIRAINAAKTTTPTIVSITADSFAWSNSAAAVPACALATCGRGDVGNIKPFESLAI